jgi:hypothetical protein
MNLPPPHMRCLRFPRTQANYFRDHIPNLSTIVKPLHRWSHIPHAVSAHLDTPTQRAYEQTRSSVANRQTLYWLQGDDLRHLSAHRRIRPWRGRVSLPTDENGKSCPYISQRQSFSLTFSHGGARSKKEACDLPQPTQVTSSKTVLFRLAHRPPKPPVPQHSTLSKR